MANREIKCIGKTRFNPPITDKNFTIETTINFDSKGMAVKAKSKQISSPKPIKDNQ